MRMAFDIDVRDVVRAINVPTLIIHAADDQVCHIENARFLARSISGSKYVELDSGEHVPWFDPDDTIAEIREFLTGTREASTPDRALATVLFTDLVGSTERAASLGDEDWKSVLDRHDNAVRVIVGRSGGSVIKTTGDGVLALLPSAGDCIRVAAAVRRDLAADGLDVRIGAHVGDIDRRGDDVSGLAVNIASRVMSKAGAAEILVTASVVAAVAGQAVAFESLGAHDLKGVPGPWELFRVTTDT
jgi:class 3 adenylate cyclase